MSVRRLSLVILVSRLLLVILGALALTVLVYYLHPPARYAVGDALAALGHWIEP